MSTKETVDQEVTMDENVVNDQECSSADDTSSDNVSCEEGQNADTMADQGSDVESQLAEMKDKYIRLQAEFDNFRKRTLKEKMDLVQTGGSDVLKSMLQVNDDVERAVVAMSSSDDIEALRSGVTLISQKFIETLRQKGVTQIEALDQDFDEELHEAIARFAAGDEKRGKVIDVVQTGYMIGDKVLRFAKVVVGE